MRRTCSVLLALTALALTAVAAPGFEPVPEAARAALKGARGKPFSAGLLFCEGACVMPPYRVARYGTALFVNNRQITDQVVPWARFLATQDGTAVAPPKPVAPKPAEKEPAPDTANDDLFDESPATPAPAPVAATPAAAPAPAPATESVAFTENARSKALLKRINAARFEVQRKLKEGYICFYGSRYARVIVEPRVAKALLAVLPEAIRDAENGAGLAAKMRAKGFAFMNLALCEDLIRNRADYPKLRELRKVFEEEASLKRMLQEAQ